MLARWWRLPYRRLYFLLWWLRGLVWLSLLRWYYYWIVCYDKTVISLLEFLYYIRRNTNKILIILPFGLNFRRHIIILSSDIFIRTRCFRSWSSRSFQKIKIKQIELKLRLFLFDRHLLNIRTPHTKLIHKILPRWYLWILLFSFLWTNKIINNLQYS